MYLFVDSKYQSTYLTLFRRLLSCLPPNEALNSLSPNGKVSIAEELAKFMKKFGEGHKAWVMTNTMEKLKDAQKRGKEEVEWQK